MKRHTTIVYAIIRRYIGRFLICQGYVLLATAASLAFPYVLKTLLDTAFAEQDRNLLFMSMAFLAIVFAVQEVSKYLRTNGLANVGNRLIKDMRAHTYESLQKKPMVFYDEHKSGDIVSGLTNDILLVQSTVTGGMVNAVQAVISLIGVLIALFFMQPFLAAITVSMIPMIVWLSKVSGRRVKPVSKVIREKLGTMTAILQESIAGMDVIKLFGLQSHAIDTFLKENESLVRVSNRETAIKAANSMWIGLLYSAQFLTIVGLGAYMVFQSTLTPGSLIAFILYSDMVAGPLNTLAGLHMDIKSASAAVDRLGVLWENEIEKPRTCPSGRPRILRGAIEFRHVGFSYKNPDVVLQDVDFAIEPGQKVAIVGCSGSGKSTILKLIPRFYDPQKGSVMIDGTDVCEYEEHDLREPIAFVPQDSFLFGFSIRENLLCGCPNATRYEVEQAAKAAFAHEFITRLPKGYDTVVGERGATLSGGQRQRIAIARAFLKRPRILLLDEATSALDGNSEKVVSQAMMRLMENKTVVMIAHRLSTIEKADMILVMDRGRIVQKGTHDALIASCAPYQKLHAQPVMKHVSF